MLSHLCNQKIKNNFNENRAGFLSYSASTSRCEPTKKMAHHIAIF